MIPRRLRKDPGKERRKMRRKLLALGYRATPWQISNALVDEARKKGPK